MENPQAQKPWKVEYAKSSRSSCKTCKSPIEKETLRLGKMVQATQFDGVMPVLTQYGKKFKKENKNLENIDSMWNHADCIMKKSNQIKSTDDVEGLELIRWEDQQKVRSYVQSGGPPDTTPATSKFTTKECGIEVSPTSRATCKQCSQKILKTEVRISTKPEGQGPRSLAWNHANCFMELSPSIEVEKLPGWETLPVSDQEAVRALVKKVPSNAGTKRRKDAGDDQKSKVARSEGDVSMSRDVSVRSASDVGDKLEAQTKELWALKDDLKKHVTNAEMREMLEANDQDSTGSELDLRERCADGMMFGALKSCPLCSGSLRYSGGMYRCHGYLSAWSKCSYSTQEPERLEGKWKIPEDTENQYLKKWFKSQKLAKPVRILPPLTPSKPSESPGQSHSSNSTSLVDLKVAFRGLPKESMEEWSRKIDGVAGVVHSKIKKGMCCSWTADTNCLVVSGAFDEDAEMRKAREFEINMSEMPLGKLSKANIQKGFEALTEIQNLLNNNGHAPSIKESLIIDASNRFFTVIPSIHPRVIRDEDDFKSKVKMLEALQDIEIASRLVGFDADSDDSLDEKYKKLRCDIDPIPHDSEDYRLIEKYLLTTHAPTHTDWSLELEEVFALEREGEFDKFAPYRKKLKNRMLLWHGSRFTNFVGILSQGLRIAPPEAPATGYMFGKGVYFADLVSKSAQYCYTDKKNPVGLMLLSEVALGEVYELKKAAYMDKPPKGKHSTKGLGKKIPQELEYVKWKDDVIVPCGKPVPSNVKASELMYNEYIVYDTAQVKMQYLLKVRFHHKR
ncbi:hypothetical protein C1H46_041032 [Malus baccata]|uniref:Poly [ADP-ribose] polymerase n=1 Tax=Malus baccata TaxID=106549 RepID=A0A540KGT6_MALBA|nr:hypothetical protein C1H46_041032 [Malus baccata]